MEFKGAVKIVKVSVEDGIQFSDGTTIEDYHAPDCCERVYADWEALKTTGAEGESFKKIVIKGIPNGGIGLNEYFVPCYNQQNGYYSSDLELGVTRPNAERVRFDVSDYVEDQID